jgi:putative Ig domain-containing protein
LTRRAVLLFACGILSFLTFAGCSSNYGGNQGGSSAPTITSANNVAFAIGTASSFLVMATGNPMPTLTETGALPAGVTFTDNHNWSATLGGTPAAGTAATYPITITATNGVGAPAVQNFTLTVSAGAPPSNVRVLTYHNDNSRDGLNANETILTTAHVKSATFGKVGTITVDGLVDAEPLYVGSLNVGGTLHNVLFVATEHDSVYAFDADTFTQLWHTSVLSFDPAGEAPSDDRGCSQVTPEIGITSTPVIDLSQGPNGTIFVVAMSKNGGSYFQRLHALDLTTGAEIGTATVISATFQKPGQPAGTVVAFDPAQYKDRAALLLLNGVIYTTWASHCDFVSYTGWIIGYNESNLSPASVFNITPNGSDGAIWMSGAGPAADASGFIYFLAANGTFDTTLSSGLPNKGDYGNAFMKLSTSGNTLSVADYFTMHNTVSESNVDQDLGSGGAMVLDVNDNQMVSHHLAVGAGKDANIYLVDRGNMGKFNSGSDNIYQELSGV